MKVLPVINDIKTGVKKVLKNNSKYADIKPIKNYDQYMKEYGLK